MADTLAKDFMTRGEKQKPVPYFMEPEEKILAFHETYLIGGNIRTWLKAKEIAI